MKNKFGIILEARMGSKRLPGKTLRDLEGKPMLERILDRLALSRFVDTVVVATTTKKADDELVSFLKKKGISSYRGSEDDVLERVCEAAEYFSIENIIELHGDNPFLDPYLIDRCIQEYKEYSIDYLSNTLETSYPQGLRVQIFSYLNLLKIKNTILDPAVREHVSLYFYENPAKYSLKNVKAKKEERRPELRFTVDTKEDFNFVSNIYKIILEEGKYPYFDLKDVIRIVDDYDIKILNKNISSVPVR